MSDKLYKLTHGVRRKFGVEEDSRRSGCLFNWRLEVDAETDAASHRRFDLSSFLVAGLCPHLCVGRQLSAHPGTVFTRCA